MCQIDYIPERLHYTSKKPLIEKFYVGDILFRRCTLDELDNPYKSISLYDLSHNIGIVNNVEISLAEDVLFSIKEDEEIKIYQNKIPCELKIKDLDTDNLYNKCFESFDKVILLLKHDPCTCMYPHCVIEIVFNEVIVTKDNYYETLGDKKNKNAKRLREFVRQELASIVVTRYISQNDYPTEG
jgi:hypothetical protein